MLTRLIFPIGELFLCCLLGGCAAPLPTLSREALDPYDRIVYVREHAIWGIDALGNTAKTIIDLDASIVAPTCSPNGRSIAFYSFEKKGNHARYFPWWELSNSSAHLIVADIDRGDPVDPGTFASPVVHSGPKRLRNFRIIPPRWSPSGRKLLVTNQSGLFLVEALGDKVQLVAEDRLLASDWSPDGRTVYYTNGIDVFSVDIEGEVFQLPPRPLSEQDVDGINVLACSPDGSRLACGGNNKLWILNLASSEITEICDSQFPIHWIAWLPSSDGIVFLSGLPDREVGPMRATLTAGIMSGHYRLLSVSISDKAVVEIFHESRLDVRMASPSLSPDGRFVAFISRPARSFEKVFVAATDGSGWRPLTAEGRCLFPTWCR